jgi:hypothetical protein
MRQLVLSVVAAVLLACAVNPVSATVLIPADVGELARDAQAIARGRVVDVEGRWTDGRRAIETIVTLETEAYLKGALGQTLQFRVPGGVLGRYRQIVLGAPQFDVGDRVIVFLGARGPSVPFLLGMGQGVFRVVPGSTGAVVMPPAVMPQPPGRVVRGSAVRQPAPLDAFERDVRALAAGAR